MYLLDLEYFVKFLRLSLLAKPFNFKILKLG